MGKSETKEKQIIQPKKVGVKPVSRKKRPAVKAADGSGEDGGFVGESEADGRGEDGGFVGESEADGRGEGGGFVGESEADGCGEDGGFVGESEADGSGEGGGFVGESEADGRGEGGGFVGESEADGRGEDGGFVGESVADGSGEDEQVRLAEEALFECAVKGNTTALIFWLKNKRPEDWRDKPEHTAKGGDGVLRELLELLKGSLWKGEK